MENVVLDPQGSLQKLPSELVLWRYLSFARFAALLSQGALHFSRSDGFGDPFEGALGTLVMRDTILAPFREAGASLAKDCLAYAADVAAGKGDTRCPPAELSDRAWEGYAYMAETPERREQCIASSSNRITRDIEGALCAEYRRTFICCWHAGEHESEAMWRLYSKDAQEGVAIRTTVGRLRDALLPKRPTVAEVEYRDDYVWRPFDGEFRRFLTKRRAFAHEHEVRAILEDSDAGQQAAQGTLAAARLDVLIERVVISPYAPVWLLDVVQRLVGRFGLKGEVSASRMAVLPYVPLVSTHEQSDANRVERLAGDK